MTFILRLCLAVALCSLSSAALSIPPIMAPSTAAVAMGLQAQRIGATRGMGRALARALAERGDALWLLGRDAVELEASARDLEARGAVGVVGQAVLDLAKGSKNRRIIFAVQEGWVHLACDQRMKLIFLRKPRRTNGSVVVLEEIKILVWCSNVPIKTVLSINIVRNTFYVFIFDGLVNHIAEQDFSPLIWRDSASAVLNRGVSSRTMSIC